MKKSIAWIGTPAAIRLLCCILPGMLCVAIAVANGGGGSNQPCVQVNPASQPIYLCNGATTQITFAVQPCNADPGPNEGPECTTQPGSTPTTQVTVAPQGWTPPGGGQPSNTVVYYTGPGLLTVTS